MPRERLRSHRMHEDRHAERRGNFQRGARLRGIDHEIAARAVDEETPQSEIANGALSFPAGPVAVIGIDRRQPMNAAGMARGERREIVVHGHDGFVRHAAFRIGDQLSRDVDDARVDIAFADVLQQKILVRQPASERFPAAALVGGSGAHGGQLEAGWNVVIVKVDDIETRLAW